MSEKTNLTILSPVGSYRHPLNNRLLTSIATSEMFNLQLFECYGHSEVSRARNFVASLAHDYIEQANGYVFWLDADMTLLNFRTFLLHLTAVANTQKAISGRYVRRQDETKVAASKDDRDERTTLTINVEKTKIILEPAVTGMGCLLMPADLFLQHAKDSFKCERKERGKPFTEYLMCCPQVIKHEKHGHVMISEDFDYCNKIRGGSWLAEIQLEGYEQDPSQVSYLDYGHVAERVLAHANKKHTLKDDR